MKLLVLLSCVAFATCDLTKHLNLTDDETAMSHKINNDCLVENGLEDAEVNSLTAGNFTDKPSIGCHLFCYLKKMKRWSKEGGYRVDLMQKAMYDPRLRPIIEECFKIKNDDICIENLEIYHCYLINAEKSGATRF